MDPRHKLLVDKAFLVVVLVVSVVLALWGLPEVSSRESYVRLLDDEINSVQAKLADNSRLTESEKERMKCWLSEIRKAKFEIQGLIISGTAFDNRILPSQIQAIEAARNRLVFQVPDSNVNASDDDNDASYPNSQQEIPELNENSSATAENSSSVLSSCMGVNDISATCRNWWQKPHCVFIRFSSNMLVAITMICSALVGVMFAGIRKGEINAIVLIATGIATGFFSFFLIKGGYQIFFTETDQSSVFLNSYSGALFAALAGFFSDKFVVTLSRAWDALSRIKETKPDSGEGV